MSEAGDKDQKTEEATPRQRDRLREEGKVAQSQDVTTAALTVTAILVLYASAGSAIRTMTAFSSRMFRLVDARDPMSALASALRVLGIGTVPMIATGAVVAIAVGMVQTKGLFSLDLVAFKPERLDPLPQLKKILPSKESLLEIGKQLLKLLALGFVVYGVVSDGTQLFTGLAATEPLAGAATVGSMSVKLALHAAAAFVAVAGFDYWLAHRRFEEDAKMSKQDVKDEHKQQEGDPHIKGRIRQRMREMGRKRSVLAVKDATVLIANPTHIAIALRYEPDRDNAPIVLAKGLDAIALRMRQEARKHKVPVIENRPLARALYKSAKEGKSIPVALYQAVAEVIAQVFRMRSGGVG